jgi:hypothetical protein
MSQGETEPAGPVGTSTGVMLFALLGGAVAWSVHFLGSYALIAVGCVSGWTATPGLVGTATVALAAVAAWSTAVAWRRWGAASAGQSWDRALSEPRGWYAWLMTVGVLLGATSTFAIVLEGAGSLLLPVCGWDVR